ncbi:MAG: alpha-2-macroglobulin family protein [Akkermansiaceae bacterium]|nr:alpha-2-macroglobulin family protein [Akkermansiaceae bacterium]
MKTRILPIWVFLIAIVFGAGPRDAEWKKVEEAQKKDQPKTQIELLAGIEKAALADEAWAEAARAVAMRIATEGKIEGPGFVIKKLDAELEKAPAQVKPVLRALAAGWMQRYYYANQWRFARRSSSRQAVGDDLETWDLARILKEVDSRMQMALSEEEALKATPIAEMAELMSEGELGDEWRPTLFDFVADRALIFYSSEEVAVSRPKDSFAIKADAPVFGTVEELLGWKPEAKDQESPKFRALVIYQKLLEFHQKDQKKDAFYLADLERLRWASEAVDVADREARLEKALRRFIEEQADHPISAWARVDLGRLLEGRDQKKDAHGIYQAGAKAFPEHPFGKLCRNDQLKLEHRNLRVSTETSWTPVGEEIHVTHTNVKHVWFRLYPFAFEPGRATIRRDPLPDRGKWLPALLKGEPVRAWDEKLVDQGDFETRFVSLNSPENLPDGYHVLVASADENFSLEDNAISIVGIHVTPLALLVSNHPEGRLEGHVVDAVTGDPLAGIEVESLVEAKDQLVRRKSQTDGSGYFRFKNEQRGQCLVVAKRGVQRAVVRMWDGGKRQYEEKDQSGVVFFTDRSIYRPGQTVHFKGIWYLRNQSEGKYELLKNKEGSVVFRDPNGKEVARLKTSTNARGSFSGSFTAPNGSVLGQCRISLEGVAGPALVRVEEYKRPKFFAKIDAPKEAVALNEVVKLKVRAAAYTGAPVDGAKVTWRVVRTPRLPAWSRWCWWNPVRYYGPEEIAQGVTETAADGSVMIQFVAKPDGSVREELEPVFYYSVTADVTGGAGETRSASRSILLASSSLRASLSAEDWLETGKELAFQLRTESLDGEGRNADGVLKIHRLKEPEVCARPWQVGGRFDEAREVSLDPNRWEPGEVVREFEVKTDEKGLGSVKTELAAGAYRLVFETRDANGRKIQALQGIQVVNPVAERFPTKMPFFTGSPSGSRQPGEMASVLWGSGHDEARACVEWYQNRKLLKREWSQEGRTQQMFSFPIEEQNRGGISVVIYQVTMNRLHRSERVIQVPWTNKELKLRWEHLVSKLEPGSKESWTAVVEGAGGEAVVAEMVATMYDASLDAYASNSFSTLAQLLRNEYLPRRNFPFSSRVGQLRAQSQFKHPGVFQMGPMFRSYRDGLALYDGGNSWRYGRVLESMSADGGGGAFVTRTAAAPEAAMDSRRKTAGFEMRGASESAVLLEGKRAMNPGGANFTEVAVRKNLQETAFFYPDLTSDEDGKMRITFTMPEALTKWRFLGMAHDENFRSGLLESETVTAKDLMVQPNPPRFLREGDVLEFTVKVTNQSDEEQSGTARLTVVDAATDEDRTAAMGIAAPDQEFTVPAKDSRTLRWRIAVPDGAGFLKYKAVAASGDLSDGEEGWLPVLSRRILVTESMSLPIRDVGKKEFEFTKLLESGGSETLEDRFVHVQVVSQPAWYAVMALPYLMEYPHECSEQTFNRYYANALAQKIAGSDPKIRSIFDQWKSGKDTLDSPLMKNEDLKGILLDETPWLREATNEAGARRRVGLLFDENHMDRELEKALRKLSQMQGNDGLWPWFPGGRGNEYISLYITTGFGRLRTLGVGTDITPAMKALPALDAALTRRYDQLKKTKGLGRMNLTPWVAHHLYTRTLFLKDKKLSQRDQVAFDYFTGQANQYWAELSSRMSRGHIALALHRLDVKEVPNLIARSLKENAKVTEEQGMFWKDSEGGGWYWWQAPIETQAMMIEVFREVSADKQAVDDCQVWMIKQKQVGDWKTTKATADAVYALLLGGRNLLSSDALLEVTLAGNEVKPDKVEAGTGFYESRIVGKAVKPELGKIELTKTDEGVSWASVHWQYLEDMAVVTKAEGNQLKLEKTLFVRRNTDEGPVLMPMNKGQVQVGDELVTRVILRNDLAMEFVHLKDLRGSGTEPESVLSGYRWQDGFGYYEVTRDAASHFFIDRLPPGVHVFETSVRVQHAGEYQTGIAEVRCMYAPEFAAHSASVEVEVEVEAK